jgi:hypothetical protein
MISILRIARHPTRGAAFFVRSAMVLSVAWCAGHDVPFISISRLKEGYRLSSTPAPL